MRCYAQSAAAAKPVETARSSPGLLLSQSKEMPNALPAVKCQTCNKWSLILALKP
jgi:hypothetical protein